MPFKLYLWDLSREPELVRVFFKREFPDRDRLYCIYRGKPKRIDVIGSLKDYILMRKGSTVVAAGRIVGEKYVVPSLPAPKEYVLALIWGSRNPRELYSKLRDIKFWRDLFHSQRKSEYEEKMQEIINIWSKMREEAVKSGTEGAKLLYKSLLALQDIYKMAELKVPTEEQIKEKISKVEAPKPAPPKPSIWGRLSKVRVGKKAYFAVIATLILWLLYTLYTRGILTRLLMR